MSMWFLIALPGLIFLYALFLRPFLRKIPAFSAAFDRADSIWEKIWAYCGNSLTVLWGYILGGISALFELLDQIGPIFGDSSLKDQVTNALQSNPKILGYILATISVVTIAARVRSLMKV